MNNKVDEWIVEADIAKMQEAMEAGLFSSANLVQAYIERIRKYDPKINTILEINPDAVEIAKSLDQERKEKGSRGPFASHCVQQGPFYLQKTNMTIKNLDEARLAVAETA